MIFIPYVAPEVAQKVKQTDLLTFLKSYESCELVHLYGNVDIIRFYDVKISNRKGYSLIYVLQLP